MLRLAGELQIPVLAALLIGGCLAKAFRVAQSGTVAAGLGPTALFPLKLRAPVAAVMCATELGLGIGLIATSSSYGHGAPAVLIRLGTGLLFLVATFALIELRSVRPGVGCGCFGEFSQAPVTSRTIARSALLAAAAIWIMKLRAFTPPRPGQYPAMVLMLVAELTVLGLLSPELRDVLVRIGYSAPCELRVVHPEQTLAALYRSTQWRKHADLIANREPSDIWRELCWRYVAFPSKYGGKDADLVFAVRLEHRRRPVVLSALVDAATGAVLAWPAGPARPKRFRLPGVKCLRAGRPRAAWLRAAWLRAGRRADPASHAETGGLPGVGVSAREPPPPT